MSWKQNRLTIPQKREILERHAGGQAKHLIATEMNIKWAQVKYWIDKGSEHIARIAQSEEAMDLKSIEYWFESSCGYQQAYVYLLGCYLGDGYINKARYTWKLRITTDQDYKEMINEQLEAIQVVCKSKGGIARHKNAKCVDVFGHCKHLPALFPQHGKGRKHTRPIVLEDWQHNLIDKHPWSFIKGLIHTDGCRYIQKQKYNQYVKYNFTNVSKDIIDIFTSSCDKLNLKYVSFCRKAEKQRYVSKWNIRAKNDSWIITINDRESVQLMDRHIGPKC